MVRKAGRKPGFLLLSFVSGHGFSRAARRPPLSCHPDRSVRFVFPTRFCCESGGRGVESLP